MKIKLARIYLRDSLTVGVDAFDQYYEAHPPSDFASKPKYRIEYNTATDTVEIEALQGGGKTHGMVEVPRSNVVWWIRAEEEPEAKKGKPVPVTPKAPIEA